MAKKTSIISEGAEVLEQAFKEAQAAKKAAKGPALPLNLQRAKPKTPQEITDIADRVARQQMGEHVTSGRKGDTKNLAGRSMKESKRVQDLNYELERIKKIQPSPEVTGNVGEINLAIPGDQTISDYILKRLNGLDIESPQEGGARYGWGHLDKDDPLFWASGKQPATAFQNKVNRLAELYNTDEIMAHHLAMGDTANNFAMHFADANLRAINNSELSKKSINAFNKVIEKQFPDFVGVHNPEEAYLQMQQNPELRKYFNDRMKTPKITAPLGFPNGLDIQWAITEPALRNMEISLTGHSVGRLKPGAELTETADHGTYSHGIQGEILGHAPELAPFEMSFPDADTYLRSVYNPENITGTIQKVAPHQVVDPQYLDQMNEYYTRLRQIRGFADGGEVSLEDEFNEILDFAKGGSAKMKQLARLGVASKPAPSMKTVTTLGPANKKQVAQSRLQSAQALQAKKAAQAVAPAPTPLQTVAPTPAPAPAPTAPAAVAPVTAPLAAQATKAPMYTKHEGMLFGDDFYDRYAQNSGGQYADPYHNYLMTTAKVIGPNTDIPNLYKQYQASGRTDTPDWATVDTKGPISVIPKLAHYWDASGANPVNQLSDAWNPTTPLAEGIKVPEGYWDNVLAYNMNLSKAHPSLMLNGTYMPDSVKNNNLVAKFALDNNIYDIDHPMVADFSKTLAHKGAVGEMEVGALQRQYAQYLRDQQLTQGNTGLPTYAKGGKVDLEQEFINADTIHMAGGGNTYGKGSGRPVTPQMSMPDLDTLALTGKILARKGKQQLKKEWANPSPQMAVDIAGNVGADLLGMPADMIQSARGTPMKSYKPYKGVNLEPQGTPMLGSENLRGQLEKAGITSGTERPLTENIAMLAAPFAGELKGLPVGLSIKDVSEGKKAVNFVSSVEKTIKGHKMDAMPGNQWSAWMKSNASKAAKKEADSTGLHDWLAQQDGKVTKADIEAYVEGNLPKVKVVEKGAALKLTPDERNELEDLTKRHSRVMHGASEEQLTDDEYAKLIKLANIDEKATVQNLRHQALQTERGAKQAQQRGDKYTAMVNFSRSEHLSQRADQLELEPLQYGGSKFEKYTLPGGTNYKETMLSLPIKPMSFDEYMEYNFPGARDKERVKKYYENYLEEGKRTGTYEDAYAATQSNFKSPAAHRYDDPEADYNRVAHLRTNERMTPEGKRALFLEELQSDWGQRGREMGFRTGDPLVDKSYNEPSGPYVEDTKEWTALGLKHALKKAAEEGHDVMAWTTGQQQADRYSLAQYLDNVRASKNPDGTYSFMAYEKDASRDNLPTIRQEGLTEDELSEHLGKDMAKKIVGDLAEAKPTQVANYNNLDLQIGGEGMKGYYDQILPQTMNDVLKQLGVAERVKPLKIGPAGDSYDDIIWKLSRFDEYPVGSPERAALQAKLETAPDVGHNDYAGEHLGIEITPELRDKLFSEGLPHFHDGGNVQYNPVNLEEEFKKSKYGV